MTNTIESPSRQSHSKETFPEIEINKIRRAQIINIFGYLKKLDNRVTKLEKKRKWWWGKKDKKTANPKVGLGKKKRTKRRYKKKRRKYKKKRTKKKSHK